MIRFCAITEENFDTILQMKRPAGEGFVADNSYALAQAWLYRSAGDVFPFAIYNDETPVGFMMLEELDDPRQLCLWRIMLPPEHCGKGYGTEAVRLLIRLARESGKYDALYLDCAPTNHIARKLYEKLGFIPTGEINHGSVEMKLPL